MNTQRKRLSALVAGGLALALLLASIFSNPAAAQDDETRAILPRDDFAEELLDTTGYSVDEWVPAWTVTREDMGFATRSPEWLANLAVRSSGQSSYLEFGVPLTNAEQREMARRDELLADLSVVEAIAEGVDGYAGTHVEIRSNGKSFAVVSATTRIDRATRLEIKAQTSLPSRIKFRKVEFDLESLTEGYESIIERGPDGAMHSVSIDIPGNEVVVSMEPAAHAAIVGHAGAVADAQGVPGLVSVQELPAAVDDSCNNRRTCHTDLRGGTRIFNRSDGDVCTGGFIVDHINQGYSGMLTARHCGQLGDEFALGGRRGPSGDLYTVTARAIFVDAMVVEITEADQLSRHFYRMRRDKFHRVSNVVPANTMFATQTVCLQGIRVGRACGTIVDPDAGAYRTASGFYNESFTYRLTLPGNWQCGANPPPGVNSSSGGSGGPITTGSGASGFGIHASCRQVVSQTIGAFNEITSTTIELRGLQLEHALAGTGTDLR